MLYGLSILFVGILICLGLFLYGSYQDIVTNNKK